MTTNWDRTGAPAGGDADPPTQGDEAGGRSPGGMVDTTAQRERGGQQPATGTLDFGGAPSGGEGTGLRDDMERDTERGGVELTGAPAERGQAAGPSGTSPGDGQVSAMLPEQEANSYRARWNDIQAAFVDDPRNAVATADGLVLDLTGRLAQIFSDQRAQLEEQWARGGDTETEQLRVALQHYRAFFETLLHR